MTAAKTPLAAWVLFLAVSPLTVAIFAALWLYGAYGRAFSRVGVWRTWFAWRPVVLGDGSVARLRLVERCDLGNGFSAYRLRTQVRTQTKRRL